MWHKVRKILTGNSDVNREGLSSAVSHRDETALRKKGYLVPQPATLLLDTEHRQQLLRQLWENCLLPQAQYEQYFLGPLKICVSLMQQLPASACGEHAVTGGMVDYTLKTVVCAARLSRGYMLPPGASAEEQSAQSAAWGAVVFYCALFHALSVLRQIEGELLDGEIWYPGISVPGQPYRFRFRPDIPDGAGEGLGTMLGMRLLPGEVILWLSQTPQALDTLLSFVRGDVMHAGVINQIVENAIVYAGGKPRQTLSGSCVVASPAPSASVPVMAGEPADIPATALTSPADPAGEGPLSSALHAQEVPVATASLALTSALDDNIPSPVATAPGGQEESDPAIQAVMSLMGFEQAPPVEEAEPESQAPGVTEAETTVAGGGGDETVSATVTAEEFPPADEENTGAGEDYGEQFIAWLKTKILSGQLAINTKEAQIHIVGGLIFLPTPGVFFLFMKDTGCPPSLKNDVQRGFERLGVHFIQKGKGLFTCLKYENENRSGRYEKVSGYFIKSRKIYMSHSVPDDSLFLFVSKCK
ncbi:TraI domain-containing protein [Salmonella enterica subsp. diarizonae serovar 48:r:z]